jgi:TonB family protein
MRHILASTLMLSSILLPAVANASSSTDDAAATTSTLRVSTGVTAPALINAISLPLPDGMSQSFVSPVTQVGLTLTVDADGAPQNVKIVKSSSPYWDSRVVDAIQKSHFRPGKMDNAAIPVDMNLIVNVTR